MTVFLESAKLRAEGINDANNDEKSTRRHMKEGALSVLMTMILLARGTASEATKRGDDASTRIFSSPAGWDLICATYSPDGARVAFLGFDNRSLYGVGIVTDGELTGKSQPSLHASDFASLS